MSSNSEGGGRFQAVFGPVIEIIKALRGSKPRMLIFASGFVLVVMAILLGPDLSRWVTAAGIAILAILVVDLARGGTVAD